MKKIVCEKCKIEYHVKEGEPGFECFCGRKYCSDKVEVDKMQ